jgi:hypothetical protein
MLTHVFTGAFFTPEECNERSMQKLAIWIANSNVINSQNAPLLHMALVCLLLYWFSFELDLQVTF